MASFLTPEDISSRVKNFHRDGYLYIGSILKGVTYAASTIVLLEILSNFPENWFKIPLWSASMCLAIVSYATWGRGALLANQHGNICDSILPLILGILEFILFGILSENEAVKDTSSSSPLDWRLWFVFVTLYHLVAVGITFNRLKNVKVSRDFAPELKALGEESVDWIKGDRLGATGGMLTSLFLVFLVFVVFKNWGNWNSLFSLSYVIIAIIVIRKTENQRKKIIQYLEAIDNPSSRTKELDK